MDFAASVKNLFKKRDFKEVVEKSLGEGRNFENVLTDVFAVCDKLGFFQRDDWEATIIQSITNVIPPPKPDPRMAPQSHACVDDAAAQTNAESPSRIERRRHRLNTTSKVGRRSERIRWQAERYTYN